ncbi:glutathione S-transferase N-terminal domain-containing protein [Caenimonas terrae]|uniref:Glutathione S-transferase N-terminal domain-containing protein n=1 Tax=Caenimonas terrae TaxID=696074 RepID=A0ABW0NBH5_9BURK
MPKASLALPLLYTYRRCPYAMRARMALLQASVTFDAHEIVLRDKPPGLLAVSPKATVPVLVLPDGRVIQESLDIMRWAFEGRDQQGWWSRAQTPGNQALVALNDGPFKRELDLYKYPQRAVDATPAFHRDEAAGGLLHALEERLATAPWLGGIAPCAADLAVFPFVRQFRAVDPAWFDGQACRATRQWVQAWLDGDQFHRCMKKMPPGLNSPF